MARPARRIDELTRQLNLLPYFQRHPDRTVMEAARDFGLQPAEIMEDLNRLWMCGLPGLLPGDLVELEHSYTSVKIHNAQGMDKPLRLTPTEAGVLLLTLESLENLPGLTDQEAVVSAAEKLRRIMGDYTTAVYDSVADGEDDGDNATLSVLRDAMQQNKQVCFTYHSHSSDTTKLRQVSPARIFTHEGEAYVRAWEEESGDHRNFRIDGSGRSPSPPRPPSRIWPACVFPPMIPSMPVRTPTGFHSSCGRTPPGWPTTCPWTYPMSRSTSLMLTALSGCRHRDRSTRGTGSSGLVSVRQTGCR